MFHGQAFGDASTRTITRKRPANIASANVRLTNRVFVQPGKGAAIGRGARGIGVEQLRSYRLPSKYPGSVSASNHRAKVDKNADGSMIYHFVVKADKDETLTPGDSADFVTVYNFYSLVEGSAKVPPGWLFSSEPSGRTPSMDGYPLVLPIDVPNTLNFTWTVTKPVAAGAEIDGFTATTRLAQWCRVNTRRR